MDTDLIVGAPDTEQTLIRRWDIRVLPELDLPVQYRNHEMRPHMLSVTYRVNRGMQVPAWYIFEVRIYGNRVLKGGKVSANRATRAKNRYYERGAQGVPEWAAKIAKAGMPTSAPEV